jgi:hypothetical protein
MCENIGLGLRDWYRPKQDIPDRFLALLTQLETDNVRPEAER